MADRYRVLNGNWDLANSWSTTSGGAGGAIIPTSSNDVYFDSNTPTGTHTVNLTSAVKGLDFTGFSGTFAGSGQLTLNGNLILSPTMIRTYTGVLICNGHYTYTSNNISLDRVYASKGTSITLIDKLTLTRNTTATTTSANMYILGGFVHNNQTVEVTGTNSAFRGNISFYNLIKSSIGQLIFYRGNTITINNSIQVNGNSTTKQIIKSDLAGTQATIHNNTGSTIILSNCDIKDINFTGDGWIADKTCIDSGNNTGIKFADFAVSKLFAYDLENSSTNVYTTINVSVVGTGLDKLVFYIGEYNGVSTTYSEVTLIGTTTSRTGSITLSGNNYRGINWKAEADSVRY